MQYIRVVLIHRRDNIRFGARVEKVVAQKIYERDILCLDIFMLFKLLSIKFPVDFYDLRNRLQPIVNKISKSMKVSKKEALDDIVIKFSFYRDIYKNSTWEEVADFINTYASGIIRK